MHQENDIQVSGRPGYVLVAAKDQEMAATTKGRIAGLLKSVKVVLIFLRLCSAICYVLVDYVCYVASLSFFTRSSFSRRCVLVI